ncbi:DUF305 domain-containing protein [Candidatus Saccharibacteria bacterium]|nr:DUF305 domain-containing protein [Candidatus Saccharibacteria bacterium]
MNKNKKSNQNNKVEHSPFFIELRLILLIAAINFVVMFFHIYGMINSWGDFYVNLNQIYIAGAMVGTGTVIEVLLMHKAHKSKKLVVVTAVAGTVLFIFCFYATRGQWFIDDRQFARSMIPHHSGTILMCRRANLKDRELIEWCQKTIDSHERAIDELREILGK